MCEDCRRQAAAHWGVPMPEPRELIEAIKARAEVALDCGLLASEGCHLSSEGAQLVAYAIHQTLLAMAEETTERGLAWAPMWITVLGQETALALAEEEQHGTGT